MTVLVSFSISSIILEWLHCSWDMIPVKAFKAHWNPSKGRWKLEFKELQQLNLQSNQCNLHWSTTKALLMMLILIAWESFINFGRFFVCSWLYQHFWLWLGCEKIENKHFDNEKWMSTIKIHSQLNLWYKIYDIFPKKKYEWILKTCIILNCSMQAFNLSSI